MLGCQEISVQVCANLIHQYMYENSRFNWQLFLRQICSSHSKAPRKTLHQLSTLRGNTNNFMSLEPSAYSEQALTLQS